MFGKQADLSYVRIMRAFVHVADYTKHIIKARPWQGVLIGYDDDKLTVRVYELHTSGYQLAQRLRHRRDTSRCTNNRRHGGSRSRGYRGFEFRFGRHNR